jgi:hypothetical protein
MDFDDINRLFLYFNEGNNWKENILSELKSCRESNVQKRNAPLQGRRANDTIVGGVNYFSAI